MIPELVEQTLNTPWHLAKGMAHLAGAPIRAITGTEYLPKDEEGLDDSDTWTSVYDIADPMMDITTVIYFYTELRSATKKRLEAYAKTKNLSVRVPFQKLCPDKKSDVETIRIAVAELKANLEALESKPSRVTAVVEYQKSLKKIEDIKAEFNLGDGDMQVFKIYFSILEEPKDVVKIKSDIELYKKYISPQFSFAFGGKDFNLDSVISMVDRDPDMFIHHIDDDFASPSFGFDVKNHVKSALVDEVVYAIAVSEKNKRITVVFRGSVNIQDWVKNVQISMTDLELPGFTTREEDMQPREMYGRVHEGFYKYLFEETKEDKNGFTHSKSEEIMGILKDLSEEYKGFSIFVTGHSLGGSLSTLFAFRAAAFGDFPLITNVSFASPYCGDQGFRDQFYELEKMKRIRHLRISNDEDAITLFPPVAPGLVPEFYKHTGMNIRLYDDSRPFMPKCRLFYPKKGDLINEVKNAALSNVVAGLSVGVVSKHLCPEYRKRLDAAKEELQELSLEGLYSNKDITGWSYRDFPGHNKALEEAAAKLAKTKLMLKKAKENLEKNKDDADDSEAARIEAEANLKDAEDACAKAEEAAKAAEEAKAKAEANALDCTKEMNKAIAAAKAADEATKNALDAQKAAEAQAQAAENARKEEEAARIKAEEAAKLAEQARKSAEEARIKAEERAQREEAEGDELEADLKAAEEARLQAEEDAKAALAAQQAAEDARAKASKANEDALKAAIEAKEVAEAKAQVAEQARKEAEEQKIEAEANAKASDEAMQAAVEAKDKALEDLKAAEFAKKAAEAAKVQAEIKAKSAEEARKAEEAARIEAEEEAKKAEEAKVQAENDAKAAEEAKLKAEEAQQKAEAELEEKSKALEEALQALEKCKKDCKEGSDEGLIYYSHGGIKIPAKKLQFIEEKFSLPATISFDVTMATTADPCIAWFTSSRAPWGNAKCDALTWFLAGNRDDYTFRFKGYNFAHEVKQLAKVRSTPGKSNHLVCKITSTSAEYVIDGKLCATAKFPSGTLGAAGYLAFHTNWNSQLLNLQNIKIVEGAEMTPAPSPPPKPAYAGRLYVVAGHKIILANSTDIEQCKALLVNKYGYGARSPQRMIVEVMNGKVVLDPHKCAGQNQGGGQAAGFNKYWNDWPSIRSMQAIVRSKVEPNVYGGHLFVVAGNTIVKDSTNIEVCKNYLNQHYGREARSPQRMIVEVKNGQVIQDPHSCAGQNQGGGVGAGFNKWWNDWPDIRNMQAVVTRAIN